MSAHETAEQAVEAHRAVGARTLVHPEEKLDYPIGTGLLLRHDALTRDLVGSTGWMPREDSNLDKRYQKPLSYH